MKTEIKYIAKIEHEEWKHFLWSVSINGIIFEYKTGLGHATSKFNSRMHKWTGRPKDKTCISTESEWVHVPNIDEVLNCLFLDASCGAESFKDFCDNFGYDSDSMKAFDIYKACGESENKLRKALGPEYATEKKRIEALEL